MQVTSTAPIPLRPDHDSGRASGFDDPQAAGPARQAAEAFCSRLDAICCGDHGVFSVHRLIGVLPVRSSRYPDGVTTPADSAPELRPSSGSRVVVLVGLIVLSAIALLICAGAMAAPIVLFRFRAVEQRQEAERARQEAQETLRKAAQDAATRQQNAVEPDELNRTQPQ